MQTGDWKTTHGRIPNVVPGVGEVGEDEDESEEYEDEDVVEEAEDGEAKNESGGLEQNGKGGWSPALESIIEEI
jgi:hypothetical protein